MMGNSIQFDGRDPLLNECDRKLDECNRILTSSAGRLHMKESNKRAVINQQERVKQQRRMFAAIDFAARKHKDQRRKDSDKTPYINHPIECMNILAQCEVIDTDTLIAAVLHDTIEDTETSEKEIKDAFGDGVLKIVLECSDDKKLDKVERKKRQILHAHEISNPAKLVKLADKYSNILGLKNNPPASWSKDEIDGYIYWAYAVCVGLFGVNKALDELLLAYFDTTLIKNFNKEMLAQKLEAYYTIITPTLSKDEKAQSDWPIAVTERIRRHALNKFLVSATDTECGDYKHLKRVLDGRIAAAEYANEFPVKLVHSVVTSENAFGTLGYGLAAKYSFRYSERGMILEVDREDRALARPITPAMFKTD